MDKKVIEIDLDFNETAVSLNGKQQTGKMFWTTDKKSAVLKFVSQDFYYGCTASLVLNNITDGSIVQKRIEVTETPFDYLLSDEEITRAGTWYGQVVVEKEGISLTNRMFSFVIQGSLLDMKEGALIDVYDYKLLHNQLNVLRTNLESYLTNANASELARESNYLAKVDAAIVSADIERKVSTKVTELTPTINKVFTDLGVFKQETTAQFQQNGDQMVQTDFVELGKRYNNFDNMQIQKKSDTLVVVSLFNLKNFISFDFATYADDYWVQSYVRKGMFEPLLQGGTAKRWADLVTTGAWKAATSSLNGYTFEVGATFKTSIIVDSNDGGIMVVLNANSSGGLWEIKVDGEAKYTEKISVYNSTSTKRKVLLGRFSKGTHEVVGKFLGADPKNVVSNPRGWVNSSIADTVISGGVFVDTINADTIFTTPSNKDFAFNISPKDSNNYEFVPSHGTNTAINAEDRKFYNGNEEIEISNMVNNEFKELDSFCLTQHIYGRNSLSGVKNLIEIWSNQRLSKDGLLSMDGKMKVLAPIDIKNSYTIMGVAKGDLFTKIISPINNQYVNNSALYGTSTKLLEADKGISYAFLSEFNKDVFIAIRYNDIRRTLRQKKTMKDLDSGNIAYLQHRDANVLKLYNRLFDSGTLEIGFTHNYSGDFCFGIIPNAYDVFS